MVLSALNDVVLVTGNEPFLLVSAISEVFIYLLYWAVSTAGKFPGKKRNSIQQN